jgi:hypothetical protein
MTQATVGDIRSARKWVEELAAQHKGVRVAYLLCRMNALVFLLICERRLRLGDRAFAHCAD